MKISIFSINSFIIFEKIKNLKIFINKKSYSILKNHIPTIGCLEYIYFLYKKKFFYFYTKNGYFLSKKKKVNIICTYYEFL